MGTWRVALSEPAELDLERVTAFLARKSVVAAERIGLEIVVAIFSLEELPARGAMVRSRPGLRKVVHRHYVVTYRLALVADVASTSPRIEFLDDPFKRVTDGGASVEPVVFKFEMRNAES